MFKNCQRCVYTYPVDVERLRIGEVARRVGISPHVLRAWERRYGVPRPLRTDGGFRLYPAEEVARLRRMRSLIDGGFAPAEAARVVRASPSPAPSPPLQELAQRMELALDRYDERGAHEAIDRLLASFSVWTVLAEVFLPYLRRLGERWAEGEVTVAHEHFGASVIRGRLLGLARAWADGPGPTALLACPAGELHDLGLLVTGVALGQLGWRVVFLGADTPAATLAQAAEEVSPDVVVLAVREARLRPGEREEYRRLAGRRPLLLGGPAARRLAARLGAKPLKGDPVAAARALAAGAPPGPGPGELSP